MPCRSFSEDWFETPARRSFQRRQVGSLTMLREKLVKIGATVVRHARYVTFQMAEVAIPGRLFATIPRRIGRLYPVPLQRRMKRSASRLMSDRPGGSLCGHAAKR